MKSNKINLSNNSFNYGTNKPINVLNLVNLIIKKSKKNNIKIIINNNAKNEIVNQFSDFAKAKRLLKWKPSTSLDKGLDLTFKWYKNFIFNKK